MTERRHTVRIATGNRTIVSVDNYGIAENEITFLFGESGIGKSMISKALYGLLDPGELSIDIDGRPYLDHLHDAHTRAVIQSSFFVFQEPSSHLNSLMKISEQLAEGSLRDSPDEQAILRRLWQSTDDAAIRRVTEIFPKPYRPSGGEKQRVLLAMAFKKIDRILRTAAPETPTFFVFDEPTGSLDDNYRNVFLSFLFEKYLQRPFTIQIITHDYSIISEVYRKYGDLKQKIHFKELSRTGSASVVLEDFSAEQYLSWLGTTRDASSSVKDPGKPVLLLDPSVTVFGRNLRICADAGRTKLRPLSVERGEMVYLKAASGVGKTTIAKVVLGLYRAQKLSMTLSGMSFTEATSADVWLKKVWGRTAGMVFQHADESLNLQSTVRETFAGLPTKERLTGDALTTRLSSLFEGEITERFLGKKVAYLSGGQKQRLNLLRTLVLDTDLIILDEPLNGLDFLSIKKVLDMLEQKRRAGAALFMISHNEEIFDSLVGKDHVYYLGEATHPA
jgi:ABC-type glutathione transport system ATPase component